MHAHTTNRRLAAAQHTFSGRAEEQKGQDDEPEEEEEWLGMNKKGSNAARGRNVVVHQCVQIPHFIGSPYYPAEGFGADVHI